MKNRRAIHCSTLGYILNASGSVVCGRQQKAGCKEILALVYIRQNPILAILGTHPRRPTRVSKIAQYMINKCQPCALWMKTNVSGKYEDLFPILTIEMPSMTSSMHGNVDRLHITRKRQTRHHHLVQRITVLHPRIHNLKPTRLLHAHFAEMKSRHHYPLLVHTLQIETRVPALPG